jgi:hypothetical protein
VCKGIEGVSTWRLGSPESTFTSSSGRHWAMIVRAIAVVQHIFVADIERRFDILLSGASPLYMHARQ